jgi:hypothetical protein
MGADRIGEHCALMNEHAARSLQHEHRLLFCRLHGDDANRQSLPLDATQRHGDPGFPLSNEVIVVTANA